MNQAPVLPSMIGRYQLVERINEGGTGEVFRAYDTETGRWCALKRLLPDLAKKSALRTRFEREGITMSRLEHPNIAKVYDVGTDKENVFLVMDYAEAGSVADWLERNQQPMPPRMAVALIISVCHGLQYAHDKGVIHRDIKPHNLLLGRDGVCQISDFGIAMVAAAHTRMTLTGTVMGTLGYVAPEQYESAKHIDERADVYSMAATLYTLVHGEAANHLFMADDSDYQGIPKPLADVIRKGAQYQRDARHQTIAEFAADLEAVFEGLPFDPPNTPSLVPSTIGDLDPAPLALPNVPETLPVRHSPRRSPSPLMRRNTPASRTPLGLDNRTPSSILPRNSLTTESTINRHRRPRLRNRDEIERQVRIAWFVRFALVMTCVLMFALFMIAAAGKVNIEAAQRREAQIEIVFVEEIAKHARLWEDNAQNPYLTSGDEIRSVFEQARDERDPGRRGALLARLSTLFEEELRELDQRGESAAGIRSQIEEDSKWMKKWHAKYDEAVEDRVEVERSPLGTMGRWFFFFLD